MSRAPWQEAEASIVGALMCDPSKVDEVADLVTPDDFADSQLRRLFIGASALARAEPAPSMLTPDLVVTQVHGAGQVMPAAAEADGAVLAGIFDAVATAAYVKEHCRIVRNYSALRRLASVAQQIVADATAAHPDRADEVVERAQDVILTAFQRATAINAQTAREVARIHLDIVKRRIYEPHTERRLSFGLDAIDRLMPGGFRRAGLYLIGADTGGGKTALLSHLVRRAVFATDEGAVHASVEVPNTDIWERHVSAESRLEGGKILTGMLTADDVGDFRAATERIVTAAGERLTMLDDPRCTVARLEREVRRRNRRTSVRVGYVFVDYAQLIRSSGNHRMREEAVREVGDDLLALAGTYGLTVVAAVQFNRASASRTDKSPQIRDIRESDGLAFNSMGVILMHTPEEGSDRLDLYLRKNRMGPTGVATVRYDRARHTFTDAGYGS